MIVNKTPHPVHMLDEKGNIFKTFPKGEQLIRLAVNTVSCGSLSDGTPISKTEFGEPEGLPNYVEGIFYIVSQLVKSALPHRADLLVPAELVRDENGNILGCRSLGR